MKAPSPVYYTHTHEAETLFDGNCVNWRKCYGTDNNFKIPNALGLSADKCEWIATKRFIYSSSEESHATSLSTERCIVGHRLQLHIHMG